MEHAVKTIKIIVKLVYLKIETDVNRNISGSHVILRKWMIWCQISSVNLTKVDPLQTKSFPFALTKWMSEFLVLMQPI